VRAWVQAAGIKPGMPLWRALRKGHVQPERMHQRTLHNINPAALNSEDNGAKLVLCIGLS
jgi:hypothetical protein